MRRLVLLLMILLLPLRGWAGDVMAVGMATGSLQAEARHGGHGGPAMPPCHMTDAAAQQADSAQAASEATSTQPDGSSSCQSCDLCLPLARIAAMPPVVVSFAAHVQRAPRGAACLSVAPIPSVKPPIS